MFKTTREYIKIKKEVICNKIYKNQAKFECFADNIFTYGYREKDKTLHQFSFTCDDCLLDKMSIYELLDLKRITFFSYSIYLHNEDYINCNPDVISWSIYNYNSIN